MVPVMNPSPFNTCTDMDTSVLVNGLYDTEVSHFGTNMKYLFLLNCLSICIHVFSKCKY